MGVFGLCPATDVMRIITLVPVTSKVKVTRKGHRDALPEVTGLSEPMTGAELTVTMGGTGTAFWGCLFTNMNWKQSLAAGKVSRLDAA